MLRDSFLPLLKKSIPPAPFLCQRDSPFDRLRVSGGKGEILCYARSDRYYYSFVNERTLEQAQGERDESGLLLPLTLILARKGRGKERILRYAQNDRYYYFFVKERTLEQVPIPASYGMATKSLTQGERGQRRDSSLRPE
jgi:hypothetical protein